jgi:hypothetical protein
MHAPEAVEFDEEPPFYQFADMLLGVIKFARALAGVADPDPEREDKAVSELVVPLVLGAVGNRRSFSDPEMVLMFAGVIRLAGEILEPSTAKTPEPDGGL